MKVNSISALGINSVNYGALSKKSSIATNPLQRDLLAYPKGYVPYQINFTGGSYSKLPQIIKLKKLNDFPCLYCAQKMVSSKAIESLNIANSIVPRNLSEMAESLAKKADLKDLKIVQMIQKEAAKNPLADAGQYLQKLESKKEIIPDFIKQRASRKLSGAEYTQKAISTISEYEDGLMPVEKKVFKMIKESFNKNPKQTLSEILTNFRKNTIGHFSNSQTEILDEIDEIAKNTLTKQTRDAVLRATEKSKNILANGDSKFPFKRKKFIEVLNKINLSSADIEGMEQIMKKAESIPTSGNDVNAFIAKYTNRNMPSQKGLVQRSDQEIAQRLLEPSIESVEHIRPQTTFKNINKEVTVSGKDNISNLALAHKQCNSDRGHLTLNEYMRTMNPKAKEAIQKHVDFIINEIKAGRLQGMDDYPQQLKETFAKESHGSINIDISEIVAYLKQKAATVKH